MRDMYEENLRSSGTDVMIGLLDFQEKIGSQKEVDNSREYKDWKGTACTTNNALSSEELKFSVEKEPVSEISVKATSCPLAMRKIESSRCGQNCRGTAHNTEDGLSRELSIETLSASKISVNEATRLLALKEVEASREETIETESSSEISVEAASLLLAMKLLKLVPPDFCLPPSPSLPPSLMLIIAPVYFTRDAPVE